MRGPDICPTKLPEPMTTMKVLPLAVVVMHMSITRLANAGPLVGLAWVLTLGGVSEVGVATVYFGSYAVLSMTGAGVVAGGIAGPVVAVSSQRAMASSISMASSLSMASLASMSSASISHASVVAEISQTVDGAISSMNAQMSAMSEYDTANDPFTFTSTMSRNVSTFRTVSMLSARQPAQLATNATGWPMAPEGVPTKHMSCLQWR